jgi:hypothetical protein
MPRGLFSSLLMVFPIFSGGIWLIFSEVIVLIAYMGSWTLIDLVITSRFLLDFHCSC